MKNAFFEPNKLRALHKVCALITRREENSRALCIRTLRTTQNLTHEAKVLRKKGILLRSQGQHDKAIEYFWNLFCADPYSVENIKLILESTQIYWKRHKHAEDLVAIKLMGSFLLLLFPDDIEGKLFVEALPASRKYGSFVFLVLSVLLSAIATLWIYESLKETQLAPELPSLEEKTKNTALPPSWTIPVEKGLLLVDQGSSFYVHNDELLSYLLHIQLRNRSKKALLFMEVALHIYDTSDQRICTEKILLLDESMGPIRPSDDHYQSMAIQCELKVNQIPTRAVIEVEKQSTSPPKAYPPEIPVSHFPDFPLRITERATSLEALDTNNFWLRKQLVLYNDDDKPKTHILLRIHFYDQFDQFLAIEKRTVIAKETNELDPQRHIIYNLGLRMRQQPTRMNIEVVEYQ